MVIDMRIVSLLPSATEIICSLGLREHLVGVTHECDYPADVVGLPIVTKSAIPHDAASNESVKKCFIPKLYISSVSLRLRSGHRV